MEKETTGILDSDSDSDSDSDTGSAMRDSVLAGETCGYGSLALRLLFEQKLPIDQNTLAVRMLTREELGKLKF